MKQLMFDNKFKSIIEDAHFWKDEEIPSDVIDFIKNKSDSKIIFDLSSEKYYCSKCFKELSNNCYCEKCHRNIDESNYYVNNVICINSIYEEVSEINDFYYYVFDVQDEKLLLYVIVESIFLYQNIYLEKISNIYIDKVFVINNDSLRELLTNKGFRYHDLIEKANYYDKLYDEENFDLLDDSHDKVYDLFFCNCGYLYTNNLYELKNSIYKYTYIWDTIKYLNNHGVSLYDITGLPLTDPSFEYYVKYGLNTLAYCHSKLTFKNNFKDTFGVDKKHLPFMIKNDINYDELKMLSYTKIEDIGLLRHLSTFLHAFEIINNDYHIDIDKIVNYFLKKENHEFGMLHEYRDYLKCCKELGFNLKDKKVLFPKDLMKEHDKVFKQYEMIIKPNVCNNIIKVGKILEINKYEDDNYVIYPAPSIDSLIEESSNQNNCVKTYAESYSIGDSLIFFMRNKSNLNKSLVTIEVKNNKVVQARIKNNDLPDYSLMNIIRKWEKKLVPIEFEN